MQFITKFCAVILVLFCNITIAQHKPRVWNTQDGLSNNWITDIEQDDQGYIWLATQNGINRFDGYTFESFTHNPENINSLAANWVQRIERKSNNELWLGIKYGGLDLFNIEKKEFNHQAIVYQKETLTSINKLHYSQNGHLYISNDKRLFRKDPHTNVAELVFQGKVIDVITKSDGQIYFLTATAIYHYDPKTNINRLFIENREGSIKKIFIDSEDQIFGLKNNELLFFEAKNSSYKISKILKVDKLVSLRFAETPIIEDSEKRIWIGGENGISIVNKERNSVEFYPYSALFEESMGAVHALSFFEDMHKNMWIGTNNGLALISTFSNRFLSDNVLPIDLNLTDIREFNQLDDKLLIAANEGLFYIDEEKRMVKVLSEKIYGLFNSKSGSIYAIGHGLFEIDTVSFAVKELSTSYFKGSWSLAEDRNRDLWAISNGNLIRYNKDLDAFETFNVDRIPTLNDPASIDLIIDSKGRLWICTLRSGAYVLENPHELKLGETPVFRNINHVSGNTQSLSNGIAMALIEASDGTIWIGTDAGLNAVNPITFETKRYLKKDGLIDEKIMALVEDDLGNIWGSTIGNGIFQLDKKTEVFNFFGQEDGLKSNNFLLSSVYKNKEGVLFFGTDNGIETINPKLFREFNRPKIEFFFTQIQLPAKSSKAEIKELKSSQNEIVFEHDANSFIINYTTLNYHLSKKTKYRYKVDNLNGEWQNNGNKRSVTFNSLPSGQYVLKVEAINSDLDFMTDFIEIKIIVKSPWWQTNIAYTCYFLLLFSLLYAVHKYLLKGKLDIAEKIRLQELDTFKTTFFNNVAHELKTPLTIISGMANNLQKKGAKEINKTAKTIIRNSNELNELVNQILDISKLEIGKLDLDLANGDIILYLKYILSSFDSVASAKEIRLHFLSEVEALHMDFDAQKVRYVFSNLISNAIKNSPVTGDIYLQVSHCELEAQFVVIDNGIGISEEDINSIFERYYQVKGQIGGTGIGLSFTSELLELMNGSINVESKLDQGASFTVKLPIEHNSSKHISYGLESDNSSQKELPSIISRVSEELPLIQIIDDNLDICSYLGSILKQDYRLNFSYTGDNGLENVINTMPDFVITDLMMPGKDGFEVCHEIKSNPITNHIPVIMLTAKADSVSKLEGLKLGADVYLAKPFDENELLIQISKLLEQRAKLREKYSNSDFWEDTDSRNLNNEFVLKVRTIIEENIDDSSFGILELYRTLGISRSNLHRKLNALTGSSTSAFIQTIKLQKARQLLKTSDKNVSEVAYEVGFEDPAYFSRLFSKTFGYPPSETRKTM
jgi:signal transduction histidine kinase/ligand-binding sensor domain-containing protein/DNA-binding response OmpR family regulator